MLSYQNPVFIGYGVLIGCLSSISAKFVLESLITISPNMYKNKHHIYVYYIIENFFHFYQSQLSVMCK